MTGFDLDHLPYGVFSTPDGPRRVGVRIGDTVLDLAAVATGRPRSSRCPSLNAFMAMGPERVGEPRGDDACPRPDRGTATTCTRSTRSRCTSRSRSATTSTSTPPSTTPPTSAGCSGPTRSRCCRTGRTCRSATTAAPARSSSRRHRRHPAARPAEGADGRRCRPTARPSGSTSRPSSASSSASRPRSAQRVATARLRATTPSASSGSTTGPRATSRPGSTSRSGPFLGKSFATSISAWVTPLAALDAAWTDLPGQDPEPLDYLASASRAGLDIEVEVVLERRGRLASAVPLDVLVAGADARPHDRQRRERAHR